jgi:hypothetical protein
MLRFGKKEDSVFKFVPTRSNPGLSVGLQFILEFPLKCTPRLRARANYIQNRENSQLLKFNNYISNKDINLLS